MNLEFGIPCHPVVTNHWHPKLNPKVLLASAKILPSDLRASARTSPLRVRPWPFSARLLCWVCLDQRPNGPNPGRASEGEVRLEGPFAGSTPKKPFDQKNIHSGTDKNPPKTSTWGANSLRTELEKLRFASGDWEIIFPKGSFFPW